MKTSTGPNHMPLEASTCEPVYKPKRFARRIRYPDNDRLLYPGVFRNGLFANTGKAFPNDGIV